MALIPPTHENLESVQATRPLTAWLIHAARSRRTMTYGQAKQRLEGECDFDVIFHVAVGRVAGAAMNRILKYVPDAPLLNVLLVRADSGLPGSGACRLFGKTVSEHPLVAEGWRRRARPMARVDREGGRAGVRVRTLERGVPARV